MRLGATHFLMKRTGGKAGEAPDLPAAKEMLALFLSWRAASTHQDREKIWRQMLEIYSDQVYSIGLVGVVFQPIVARNSLRNVPADGVYNWEPGAHFGIYRPDTFWFDR